MTERDVAPGYEQARDELIDVVRRLEAGGATLEESLALWERGEELAAICGRWLEGARARLDAALERDGFAAGGEPGGEAEREDLAAEAEAEAVGEAEAKTEAEAETGETGVVFPE